MNILNKVSGLDNKIRGLKRRKSIYLIFIILILAICIFLLFTPFTEILFFIASVVLFYGYHYNEIKLNDFQLFKRDYDFVLSRIKANKEKVLTWVDSFNPSTTNNQFIHPKMNLSYPPRVM